MYTGVGAARDEIKFTVRPEGVYGYLVGRLGMSSYIGPLDGAIEALNAFLSSAPADDSDSIYVLKCPANPTTREVDYQACDSICEYRGAGGRWLMVSCTDEMRGRVSQIPMHPFRPSASGPVGPPAPASPTFTGPASPPAPADVLTPPSLSLWHTHKTIIVGGAIVGGLLLVKLLR